MIQNFGAQGWGLKYYLKTFHQALSKNFKIINSWKMFWWWDEDLIQIWNSSSKEHCIRVYLDLWFCKNIWKYGFWKITSMMVYGWY